MDRKSCSLKNRRGATSLTFLLAAPYSQKEFAAIVDRTPRTIRRWMYEGNSNFDDLQSIAEALVGAQGHPLRIQGCPLFLYISGNLMSVFCKVLPYFDAICYND